MSTFSVDAYLQELLRDTSLPEEKVKALKEVLADQKVESRLKDTVLMRSDYSRNMDKLRDEEKALQTKLKETEDFYQAQIMADHNNREAFENMRSELEKARSAGYSHTTYKTEEEGGGQVSANYVTKEQYEKAQAQLQGQALELIGKSNFLSVKHFKEFGEPLNIEEVFKHAMSKSLPLETAYDSFTAELRQKRQEEKYKKEKDEAVQEAVRDALSKHNLPLLDSRPHGIHAIRDMKSDQVGHTSAERVAAATNAYLRGEK